MTGLIVDANKTLKSNAKGYLWLQQSETALEIAQRKNLKDIQQILQAYNHKSPRANKFGEKSVDETLTEEEFDVDAIMKDPTYATEKTTSTSSKENHHSRNSTRNRNKRKSKSKNLPDLEDEKDQFWSPYGYHPQLAELDEMFQRNPRAIKDIMDQLNPGKFSYIFMTFGP